MFPTLAFVLLVSCVSGKDPTATLLSEWPMIMAHDAATTYIKEGLLDTIVMDWTITQPKLAGVKGLMDCGARAFDWRPAMHGGKLIMHHGGVNIPHEMADVMDEMVTWSNAHAGPLDLVVLGITDCDGDGCHANVTALLEKHHVYFEQDCAKLKGMTVKQAMDVAQLPGGGHILAINSCWGENYVSANACSGFGTEAFERVVVCMPPRVRGEMAWRDLSSRERTAVVKCALTLKDKLAVEYTCYNRSKTKQFPVNRMLQYLSDVASEPPSGSLFTAQALWEETVNSIVVGISHASSLLKDELWSGLNAIVTEQIPSFKHVSMIEVNNVCNGGPDLLQALRAIP